MEKNIASLIKKLVTIVEERNNSIVVSCSSITSEKKERAEVFKRVSDRQRKIDNVLKEIRKITCDNFAEFSDIELMIACYLWASIWTSEASLKCNSKDFVDIIGRNRISELPPLIHLLLIGKSELNKYCKLEWSEGFQNVGTYFFVIKNPKAFNKLFLGAEENNSL